MKTFIQTGLAVLMAALTAAATERSEPETVLLWPDGAPGAVGTDDADKPTVTLYPAPSGQATGAAVVVCPGGGYAMLAIDHEGAQVAQWFNSMGVSAFVVSYRLGMRYHHPAPLQDVQRAIRFVRAHAPRWHIDPARVGVMGFSAGGHLASTAGTHFSSGIPAAEDPLERVSTRPDFMILVYPVISFTSEYTHRGSRRHLLGDSPDPELVRSLSNELMVTDHTPPAFLIHADDDRGVPPENSVLFYLALRRAGVPAELHIYLRGGHGFGLAPLNAFLSNWTVQCRNWLIQSGFLK